MSEDLTKDEQTHILRHAQRAKKMALNGAKCTLLQKWDKDGLKSLDFHAEYEFTEKPGETPLKD